MPNPRQATAVPANAPGSLGDAVVRAIVRAVLSAPNAYYSADGFALRVGLRNRHQLNRCLRRAGLPTFRVMAAFGRILSLRDGAQATDHSICAWAIEKHIDPAWVYRTVRRLTGITWSACQELSREQFIELGLHVPLWVWLGVGYC